MFLIFLIELITSFKSLLTTMSNHYVNIQVFYFRRIQLRQMNGNGSTRTLSIGRNVIYINVGSVRELSTDCVEEK